MKARRSRSLSAAAAAALLALGGCDSTAGLVLTGASAVSFAATDKFLGDHVVSWATGEDCSTLEISKGGDYCRPRESAPATAPAGALVAAREAPLYCYRTLGDISCYEAPDPTASSARRVQ